MKLGRAILGGAVVALAVWFLVAVFGPGGEAAPARTFVSSEQCKDCHPLQYAEWEESQHRISWTNPAVRALSNDFANQDCIDCHAPRPVFETGLGNRVLPRTTRRTEGVDCISCHQLPAHPDGTPGGMAGTVTDARAACRPVETIELASPEFCAGCHNQHQTVDEWRGSPWPGRDQDCLTCHMPPRVTDDPSGASAGRDHRFLGGNDLAMLQRAVELRGERAGEGWRIEVENVGAGHSFPTDERSRAADVFWRPLPPQGAPGAWRHLWRMRNPYRTETDLPFTLLPAGEVKELAVEGEDARGAIEVALFYKRSPYWEDPDAPEPEREATLVHRLVLEP